MNVLSAADLEMISKEEIGEDKVRKKEDIKALEEWISKSPHLQGIRKDEAHLLKFLRGCKFSLERTKEKIDFYNACRANVPSWFASWDMESPTFQKFLDWGYFLPVPGYDKHGRQVILIRSGQIEPAKTTIEEWITAILAFLELASEDNTQAQVQGIVLLNDLGNMTAQHALMINPVMAKKGVTILEEAYPSRQSVFTIVQSFQKEKMRKWNKIYLKGNYSELYEDIGQEVLPEEYGGKNGTLEDIQKAWTDRVLMNKDWFKEQTKYKSEEAKRLGKPKSHADIFGIEGSFRKLEID